MIWLLNNFTFSIFILLGKRICIMCPRILANSNTGNVLPLPLPLPRCSNNNLRPKLGCFRSSWWGYKEKQWESALKVRGLFLMINKPFFSFFLLLAMWFWSRPVCLMVLMCVLCFYFFEPIKFKLTYLIENYWPLIIYGRFLVNWKLRGFKFWGWPLNKKEGSPLALCICCLCLLHIFF